jgi:glycosyltransferase involved in cell wall biosynthesis
VRDLRAVEPITAEAATAAPRRPKVLFVCHNHPAIQPGGVQGYALDLYVEIRRQGEIEPIFVARTGPPATEPRHNLTTPFTALDDDPNQYLFYTDLTDYEWFYGKSPDKEALTRFFGDFLRAQQPDVVHFQHTLFIGYDIVRVTKNVLPDAPIVYTLHEYLPICHRDGQLVRTLANELCELESPRRCHECFPEVSTQDFLARKRFVQSHLALVDLFITPSEYSRDRYVDWGIPPEKIRVEPCGCPPVEMPPEPDSDAGRPRNRFAFFGQFTPYKGADVLLEAVDILGDELEVQVTLHGGNLESQRPEFRERFETLLSKTRENVTFAGSYEHAELGRLMQETDWVVVPSIWWETGPLVVAEAFACGRPVICSDVGQMSLNITDGVNGLHFRRADPESLAAVMRRAATAPGLWEELRSNIPAVTTMEEHGRLVTSLYRSLLAGRAAAEVDGSDSGSSLREDRARASRSG